MPAKGRKVFVANTTMFIDDGGDSAVIVHKGERVREGHPYLRGREAMFTELDSLVHHDVEAAAAESPGGVRA